jgi:hypothetical protein
MRLGEILYFAPGIQFDQVDVDGPQLPEQFRRRMAGFYLEPAQECTRRGFAFAAGVLLVSCVDALARLRFGDGVGKRFKKFAAEELQSFSRGDVADRFYDEFRNGLVHEARLKNGAQFSLETDATVRQCDGLLLVNPQHLASEVEAALDSTLLAANDGERRKLAKALKQDLAEDFRVSGA